MEDVKKVTDQGTDEMEARDWTTQIIQCGQEVSDQPIRGCRGPARQVRTHTDTHTGAAASINPGKKVVHILSTLLATLTVQWLWRAALDKTRRHNGLIFMAQVELHCACRRLALDASLGIPLCL